jgi:predicted RNase H-like HicB family nuclease
MNYEIVLYFEDGVWVAEAPELPGCACHADTEESALRAMKALIPEWIAAAREAGQVIPAPSGRHAFA